MPSLTLAEARLRAAAISQVEYDVEIDLTGAAEEAKTFASRTTVRFASTEPDTFLELHDGREVAVTVNGNAVESAYDGHRVELTGLATDGTLHEVVVDARLPYVTDGEGMHRMVDPADGQTYVSAYLGMDLAQKTIACFDQNDLKAPVSVVVTADPAWTVLGNGRTRSREDGRWEFATTPPIPPGLLVIAAGPWTSVRWEHAGLPFGWHARASLADELERDSEELHAITNACFDHYARIFEEPYPFDSYDQVLVPGLNWGAQEMPGCVTYRDEYLPRGVVPEQVRLLRAAIIAHEMSHMWFGDLVTMTWWEDTWLQESFADYMGYRVAEEIGYAGARLEHEAFRKPVAYDADHRRSTHPVAPDPEDIPDVDSAATIFDAISYAKGNSVLRQLVTWLGDETFLRGVNTYLTRHRFSNAVLGDFVAALDEASDRDVHHWVDVWLRRTGFDTLRVARDGDVPVLMREGIRPHRVRVTAYDDDWSELASELVDVDDEPVPLPARAGLVVVANSRGETFARVVLDDESADAVAEGLSRIGDDVVRAVLWAGYFDRVQQRTLSAREYVDLVARQLSSEPRATLVDAVVSRTLVRVVPLRVPAEDVVETFRMLAEACATGLAGASSPELALAFASGLAQTSSDAGTLAGWLEAGSIDDLPLTPSLRWAAVARLAELGELDADAIEDERRRDASAEGDLGAATALASIPTDEAKTAAWAGMAEDGTVSNRRFLALAEGLWSPERADLLAPYVAAYLTEGPRLAERGQGFAQLVGRAFPRVPLEQSQVGQLRTALDGDMPVVLRRMWADELDDRA